MSLEKTAAHHQQQHLRTRHSRRNSNNNNNNNGSDDDLDGNFSNSSDNEIDSDVSLSRPPPSHAARRRKSLRTEASSAAALGSLTSSPSPPTITHSSDPATRRRADRLAPPTPPLLASERPRDAADFGLENAVAGEFSVSASDDKARDGIRSMINTSNNNTGLSQRGSLRGRPTSRHFSAGAAFPASPLRDRISTYSSGAPSRRVSQASRASNYPLLLTPALNLYPPSESTGDDSPARRAGMTSVSSLGSYPHSMISYSSRDSHTSYTSSQFASDGGGGGGGTATPLSSVVSAVSDDDPYLAQVMELATQQYRDKASCEGGVGSAGGAGASLLSSHSTLSGSTPPGTIASRRGTRSSTLRGDAGTPLHAGLPLAPVSEAAPADASPEDQGAASSLAADLNASKETIYRAGRCKHYFETRYAQLALLQNAVDANVRYNPLEIIRWRRAMWQRAVRSGAEEQKKWKLRYYTWHVGNGELAEFYADKVLRSQQHQMATSSMDDESESESSDDFLGNVGKVLASRWMRGLKRRQQMDDEKDERGLAKHGRGSSSKDRDVGSSLAAAAAAFATGANRGTSGPGQPPSLLASPRSTDVMGRDEEPPIATPSLLLQFLDGAVANNDKGGSSARSLPPVPVATDVVSPYSASEESGAEQPKLSMETSKSSLSGTRPDSDVENVGDAIARANPGHGRKKSGLWDRFKEKRGDFSKPPPSRSASSDASGHANAGSVSGTPLVRKGSVAGAVDQLTHRMRRSSMQAGKAASSGGSNAGTLERAYSADAERTLGSRSAADMLAQQRSRTPSPLKLTHTASEKSDHSAAAGISGDNIVETGTGMTSDGVLATPELGLGIQLRRGRRASPGMAVPESRLDVGERDTGKDVAVAASVSKEDVVGSDSDDGGGTGRVRGRALKNMMDKIGRRQQQQQRQRDKARSDSVTEDDSRGSNPQVDQTGSGSHPFKTRLRKAAVRERKGSARNWGWESSSSEEDGGSSVFLRNKATGKSERRPRKTVKKRGTISETHSNSDLTEASESFKISPKRKKAIRAFIGNKLKNASSASLAPDAADEDDNLANDRDGDAPYAAPTTATDITTTEDEGESVLRATRGGTAATAAVAAGPAPRDPSSSLTPEEQSLYDGLLALGTRLDVLMPGLESFKTDLVTQIAACDKTLERHGRPLGVRSHSGGISDLEAMSSPQSILESEIVTSPVGSMFSDGPFLTATAADAENPASQSLNVARLELEAMAQQCQEIEERNERSHNQVSAMVADLDAVTQEVNEDLSRQLKMVEEAIQQIEGTPKALGSMQEWYYQIIAYFLGVLGFTIWLWFQLWKILRKGIAGARAIAGAVSPRTVSAVDGLSLAAGKAVKDRTLQGIASATGIAAVAASSASGEAE
ncbi:hypothetical protein HDU86_007492 [Geranomyces michiganensis]|nr:hypothetical protein HDU86_007492 [Geranomyces michiganensis]